jgi:hypothetical protein
VCPCEQQDETGQGLHRGRGIQTVRYLGNKGLSVPRCEGRLVHEVENGGLVVLQSKAAVAQQAAMSQGGLAQGTRSQGRQSEGDSDTG